MRVRDFQRVAGALLGLLLGNVAGQDPESWVYPDGNQSNKSNQTDPWHLGSDPNEWKQYNFTSRIAANCTPYETYVQTPHEPFTTGKHKVPYMRPPPECRTFHSLAAEKVVQYMKAHMKDPAMARLFENSFSMPLDTAVKWFDPDKGLSHIVTGPTNAQWLRDTELQFAHLYRLLPWDENLRNLFKSIIKTEARFVTNWTFCSAMQPPPESGMPPILNEDPTHKVISDNMQMIPNHTVYECKWNVASLASFLRISRRYWENTRDDSFVTPEWTEAVWRVMDVLNVQTRGKMLNEVTQFHFRKRASKGVAPWPRTPNMAFREPYRWGHMIASTYRPSGQMTTFDLNIPSNAMMSWELRQTGAMMKALDGFTDFEWQLLVSTGLLIDYGIWRNARTADGVFSYESNGLTSHYFMDDPMVPSLLSLAYVGFSKRKNWVYRNIRFQMTFDRNPYYVRGHNYIGMVGSAPLHDYAWPMSQLAFAYGSPSEMAIRSRLKKVRNTCAAAGVIPQGVHVNFPNNYTRLWFPAASSFFAQTILDLAKRKPNLVFRRPNSYEVGDEQVWVLKHHREEAKDKKLIAKYHKAQEKKYQKKRMKKYGEQEKELRKYRKERQKFVSDEWRKDNDYNVKKLRKQKAAYHAKMEKIRKELAKERMEFMQDEAQQERQERKVDAEEAEQIEKNKKLEEEVEREMDELLERSEGKRKKEDKDADEAKQREEKEKQKESRKKQEEEAKRRKDKKDGKGDELDMEEEEVEGEDEEEVERERGEGEREGEAERERKREGSMTMQGLGLDMDDSLGIASVEDDEDDDDDDDDEADSESTGGVFLQDWFQIEDEYKSRDSRLAWRDKITAEMVTKAMMV